MAELRFEWDGEKNTANIKNHGIDFLDAALIFENPILEAVDDRADYGEVRYSALGLSGETVLYVVYTRRGIKKKLSRGAGRTRADAPEAARMGDDFWKRARVVMPPGKTSIHLRVDNDVFDWFKKQGEGHLTRMNAVLRSYVEAQKG
jgi:uncharacterized DUF497 family protein/uncharacterized protein (DUF4415 family)